MMKAEWKALPESQKIAVSLIALAAICNLLLGLLGYPIIGHDAYVHLNWLQQFTTLRESGITYPRWLPASFGGFGSAAFYFYPPLPFFIASAIHSVFAPAPESLFHAIQLLASVLSFASSFLFLRSRKSNRLLALSGALLFAFVGYRFCDVYIRNALGEHVALAFISLLFVGGRTRTQSTAIRSIAWSGLLLSNIPMAYIAGAVKLLEVTAVRRWKYAMEECIGLLLGAIVASIYLLPLIALRGDIHSEHLTDLAMNSSLYGFAVLDMVSGKIDWLRIFSVLTLLCSIVVIVVEWRAKRLPVIWIVIAMIAIVLQIPVLSTILWKEVPGLAELQFSWRWCGILLLFLSIAFVRSRRNSVSYVIAILALSTILAEMTIGRNLVHRPPSAVNSYMLDAPEYTPRWTASDPHETIGLTLRRQTDSLAVPLGLVSADDKVRTMKRTPVQWQFRVALARPTPYRFHMLYWPLWQLTNGRELIATSPDANGYLTAMLPKGNYDLSLVLTKDKSENTGLVLSLIGATLLVILLIISTIQSIRYRDHSLSSDDVTLT